MKKYISYSVQSLHSQMYNAAKSFITLDFFCSSSLFLSATPFDVVVVGGVGAGLEQTGTCLIIFEDEGTTLVLDTVDVCTIGRGTWVTTICCP